MPLSKIDPGDRLTIGVDVVKTWDDGRVTFSLFGRTTIPGDSPQIVKVEKGEAPKTARSRDRWAS
ncbi:MAG: hypothetical protein E5X57_10405 [Mesorhizobium sp.]|uniref:hypothetical protein n=1 Tax=Mesorhizobium sp. TaxID=1871066 RepID=UPI00122A7DFB|nr:hypothetical protein [Mesorhizobium sp.]TIQ13024.1 MAG: hypothetical protein E5X57_10405 [Mesorhizobium sp.]